MSSSALTCGSTSEESGDTRGKKAMASSRLVVPWPPETLEHPLNPPANSHCARDRAVGGTSLCPPRADIPQGLYTKARPVGEILKYPTLLTSLNQSSEKIPLPSTSPDTTEQSSRKTVSELSTTSHLTFFGQQDGDTERTCAIGRF